MGIDVVRYRTELRPGVISLMRHLVPGDDAFRDAYFRWKHEENPCVPGPIAYVALDGDRVVGMRAFHGARWSVPGQDRPRSVLCACDLVVDPAYRGKALNRRIMDAAFAGLRSDGHRSILSFSANPITYHESLRIGWRILVQYTLLAIETPRARKAARGAAVIERLPGLWRYSDRAARLILRRGFERFDARWRTAARSRVTLGPDCRLETMASLAGQTPARGIRQLRDQAYYRWRLRNPASEYRFAYLSDTAETAAFAVLHRVRHLPGAKLSIVDHAATSPDALAFLIAELARGGGYDELMLWSTSLPDSLVTKLMTIGFSPRDISRGSTEFHPSLMIYDLGPAAHPQESSDEQDFAAGADWDVHMLDSDFY